MSAFNKQILLILLLLSLFGAQFARATSNENAAAMAIGPDRPGDQRCRAKELH